MSKILITSAANNLSFAPSQSTSERAPSMVASFSHEGKNVSCGIFTSSQDLPKGYDGIYVDNEMKASEAFTDQNTGESVPAIENQFFAKFKGFNIPGASELIDKRAKSYADHGVQLLNS